MNESLTTIELKQAAGVTIRNLDWWNGKGLIFPIRMGKAIPGQGRLWTRDDVLRAVLLKELRARHAPLPWIKKHLPSIEPKTEGFGLVCMKDNRFSSMVWFKNIAAAIRAGTEYPGGFYIVDVSAARSRAAQGLQSLYSPVKPTVKYSHRVYPSHGTNTKERQFHVR